MGTLRRIPPPQPLPSPTRPRARNTPRRVLEANQGRWFISLSSRCVRSLSLPLSLLIRSGHFLLASPPVPRPGTLELSPRQGRRSPRARGENGGGARGGVSRTPRSVWPGSSGCTRRLTPRRGARRPRSPRWWTPAWI
ncbi:CLIP-associated protein [Zea mays]|uniref:CLIP-associated protein n=1 Tax=Zea mays TaxID=4577 RepID=A0A1D6F945_MAIZE|nr:CLIP-associated protein [Zea mays]